MGKVLLSIVVVVLLCVMNERFCNRHAEDLCDNRYRHRKEIETNFQMTVIGSC